MLSGAVWLGLRAGSDARAGLRAEGPLKALVGPGFQIDLRRADGSPVSHLDAGTYAIEVDDRGIGHNFRLLGPGVDLATDITETGVAVWSVTLRSGVYTYLCDPHPREMRGAFAAGDAAPPPTLVPTVPGTANGPRRLRLTVAAGDISLTDADGSRVGAVRAGEVTVTVDDRTARDNVRLRGPGVDRRTSIAGRGVSTWRLGLRVGRYLYGSERKGAARHELLVVAD